MVCPTHEIPDTLGKADHAYPSDLSTFLPPCLPSNLEFLPSCLPALLPCGCQVTGVEKLVTASASLSKVSNTVRSFVIDSRSLIRFVVFRSFSEPPFLLTVA